MSIVLNLQDNKKTKVELSDSVFAVEANDSIVWKLVTIYNKRRITTAANKSRSDIAFSTKKPWQQKGSGRARCGARSSPLWRKGGVTFAKSSFDYRNSYKINKKEYRKGIRVMFSDHQRLGNIKVVSDLAAGGSKTKDFKTFMEKVDFTKTAKPKNWTGLIIVSEITEAVYMASSNLYEYMLCDVRSIDPLSLKHASEVLVTKSALEQIEEWLA